MHRRLGLGVVAVVVAVTLACQAGDSPFRQLVREAFVQGTANERDVRQVVVGPEDVIWLATKAGLRKVADGTLASVGDGVIRGPVYALSAADGHLLVGAWNGVYRVDGAEVVRLGDLDGPVTAVLAKGDRMIAAEPRGIFEWIDSAWQPYAIAQADRSPGGIRDLHLHEDLAGKSVLRAASDVGLFTIEDSSSPADRVYQRADIPHYEHASFRAIARLPKDAGSLGEHFFYGSNVGVVRPEVFPQTLRWHHAGKGESPPPHSDINALETEWVGHRHALWAATPRGILRWDASDLEGVLSKSAPPRPDIVSYPHSFLHSKRWLPSNDVRDLAIGSDGTIYAGTADGLAIIRQEMMTLDAKAEVFEEMIDARHVRPPGLVERCRLRVPGDLTTYEPMDTDNDGEYTGNYLVAQSYRYAATKSPEALAKARAAFDALHFLQTVTGTSGFIARTVAPADWTQLADVNRSYSPHQRAEELVGNPRAKIVERRWRLSDDLKWLWKGDTSSDEITGHMYAYGVYYDLAADEAEKRRVTNLVRRVVDYIIEGGYVLRDIDGQSTLWAVWAPEKLNDDPNWINERGVNSVEIISYLTLARHVTGDDKYDREIDRLLHKEDYAENILVPRPTDPAAYTYIDDLLLPMAYPALFRYEKDLNRRTLYRASLDAWFASVKNDASPCYNFIYASLTDATPEDYLHDRCLAVLRDTPLDMIHWTVDNRRRDDVQLVRAPQAEAEQTDVLLPPSERPTHRWDRNPYKPLDGEGGRAEKAPTFWLWPYWLGRYHGYIGEATE